MEYINGIEALLYIKQDGVNVPVACLTSNAIPIISAPLLKLRLYCKSGLNNTPIPKVNTINNDTPVLL